MIPILMYHEITDDPVHSYAVTPGRFEEHLRFLASNGYRAVRLDGDPAGGGRGLPAEDAPQVAITFDDAPVTNYTRAFPLLKKYGFEATFFIPTAFIDRGPEHLRREHLEEMNREGMSIQSHSHSHAFLDDLPDGDLYAELAVSKKILEEILRKKVTLLSCPGGRYRKRVGDLARSAGYRGICVSDPGGRRLNHGTPVLGRFRIGEYTAPGELGKICRMDRGYIMKKEVLCYAKSAAKGIVGNGLYHRVWKAIRG